MNQQQQLKRKISGLTNFKTVSTISNITSGKEWKRNDISRQKDDKKIIDRQPKLITMQDENNKLNPKALNFRNLKQTIGKKEVNTLCKNAVVFTKPSSQYFPKSTRHQAEPHGISINVNIQNMIPKQNENNQNVTLTERGALIDEKKSRKIVNNGNLSNMNMNTNLNVGNNMNVNGGKFDQFQCTEELVFKRTPIEKKTKFGDKTVEKIPLIDRKLLKTDFQLKPKQKHLDVKETLKKFEMEMDTINSTSESETINYMDWRQQSYMIPPNYMDRCQKNFTWKMRATLLEWMMHVCYEFAMKRETFYLSINLVDLYLSKQFHLPKSEFQLAGAAAMFIASKIQEFEPKSSEQFAVATKTYKASEVKEMEKKICKTLKYNLNPPTLSTWANRFMLQWDTYLEQNPYGHNHHIFMRYPHKFFKKWDDDSYRLYRSVMQLLDFASLDIQSVQYQPKLLVCAFMYLILGKEMGFFKLKEITNDFPRSSLYLLEDNQFNDLFMNFLQTSFNIMLIDLLPTVQYCATYFILHMNFDDPIISGTDEQLSNVEFEDFCSYQTYNPNMKLAISKRFRGIYE